ncbi:MAG: Uma2 family endonuclease [Candidatus Wallbacteria bacterium]|nr:Uma2 family endonuclease [Candidatus Wallbacteria bacterium]
MPEDGRQYEVLDGKLVLRTPITIDELNPPLLIHQLISKLIALRIAAWAEAQGLGSFLFAPTGVKLGARQAPEPDVLFVRADRVEALFGREGVQGAPDLVIEILSPGTERKDFLQKRRIYAKAGIPEYWIVDPEERSIVVLTLEASHYEDAEPVSGEQPIPTLALAGLPVKAGEIFP